MEKIRCIYSDNHIRDISAAVRREMDGSHVQLKTGSQIAITAGSRGISNIKEVIREIVRWVKEQGACPFIIPAMGSHGGATAEGQKRVIESYGITEEYTGAPIKATMEVVEIDRGDLENRVFTDKYAYEADGIIIVNRIKAHTDFHGPTESGIMKMCVIGLGNQAQALEIHKRGLYGLKELIPKTARHVLEKTNIILGVALVENACDRTMAVRAVKPQDFERQEEALLALSRANMPSIPFDDIDILIVDEMGKDISGVGIDTNLIGRIRIQNETERGKTPMVAGTDEEAVAWALRVCGAKKRADVRMVRIRNTLHPDVMNISLNLYEEIRGRADIERVGASSLAFDENGRICAF
jgi:hypothetical protein